MPPRRSHKKSKAGCQRCKTRKIKCDEIHPVCGNCMKHGVPCDFEGAISPLNGNGNGSPPVRQNTADVSNHSSPSSMSMASVTSAMIPMYQRPLEMVRTTDNSNASRMMELKLMHHFTACTSGTFADSEEQKSTWQVDIPRIAYDAPYLMDAMLAVSALHLRALHPQDQAVVRASHAYMASALSQYSALLQKGLCEANSEALFSTAALIAFQSSASRQFEGEWSGGRYTLPLSWFHSFQGVKTIVMASWEWLRKSDRVFHIINSQPALFLDLDPERKLFFAPLLDGMEEEIMQLPARLIAETRQAYVHAVAFLNWAHRKPVRNRILGFAATVSRRFVELLNMYDPRAMVIAACFFALTKVTNEVWWLRGVAEREVNGIMSIVPAVWWPKMEWALRVVNHKGEMDEVTWGIGQDEDQTVKPVSADCHPNVHQHIDLLAKMLNERKPYTPDVNLPMMALD